MNDKINYLQLLLTFLTVIIANLVTWWLNSKSKIKEIKLVNFHKDQIEKNANLFSLIVDLDITTSPLLLANSESMNSNKFKNILINWNNSFRICYHFYRKNMIFFPIELKTELNEHFKKLKKVRSFFLKQKDELDEFEEYAAYLHQDNIEEIDEEFRKLFTEFKRSPEIQEFSNTFIIIQKNIEAYFKELIK